jgi:hypothetical protein
VHGREEDRSKEGSTFGDTIAALGDLDGDRVPDFAVAAWLRLEWTGYVRIYSGKSGAVLATIEGSSDSGSSVLSLGDLDGDAVPDFAVCGYHSTVFSGASFRKLGQWPGRLLARAAAATPDGRGTLLLGDSSDGLSLVSSSNFETRTGLARVCAGPRFVCGDLDLDGWPDLLRFPSSNEESFQRLGHPAELPVQFLSGKDGTVVRSMRLDCPSLPTCPPETPVAGPLRDVNGDGTPDAFVRAQGPEGGSLAWVLDGKTGAVLVSTHSPSSTYAQNMIPLGDIDHDGRPEFLLSDYESQEGAICGGAVHLVHISVSTK